MAMNVQKQIAKKFVEYWTFQRGSEKGEDQQFWNSLLGEVLGLEDVKSHVQYQVPVPMKGTTKFLDAWIPETRVLIEHKSRGVNLDAPQTGHGGLTPYEQAVEYDNARPFDEKARWIVTCNFDEFRIYDRSKPLASPLTLKLGNLPKEAYRLAFLVNPKEKAIDRELEISVQAGRIVGEIYDALLKQYNVGSLLSLRGDSETRSSGEDSKIPPSLQNSKTPSSESNYLAALNRLCVRLVFCLYAEDAGIFPKDCFRRLMENTPAPFLRERLKKLFEILDTPLNKRDVYLEPELCAFPYTNGGLFSTMNKQTDLLTPNGVRDSENVSGVSREQIRLLNNLDDIPPITDDIRQLLIGASQFDWRDITPTIFGALFESTLNPVTRRAGGMVYTSVENIHKVIDPLFLGDLTRRVNEVLGTTEYTEDTEKKVSVYSVSSVVKKKLLALQDEMAALTFLDPACGSGNFLTETYICLRRLENRIIAALQQGQGELDLGISVKVSIAQFHGIEINDFAVAVAKTALWIAEAQMLQETAQILHREPNFLPLKDYNGIVEGNALRMDWGKIISRGDAGTRRVFVVGNPPFVGTNYLSEEQRSDMDLIWEGSERGKLDFVSCWYVKAAQLNTNADIRCAFVSTNSVVQGEQATSLWKRMFSLGVEIDFAHRTFQWDNEASEKAHVHCVIVGFHARGGHGHGAIVKTIFDENGVAHVADNINQYLIDAPSLVIEEISRPLCDVPQIVRGSQATDDGNYLFTEDERDEFLRGDPAAAQYFKRFMMGREFINNIPRYCLWIPYISPKELRAHKGIYERVQKVRELRLASKNVQTRQAADCPTRFGQFRPPAKKYIAFAKVSSQRRRYIPFGFLTDDVIPGEMLFTIPNATHYHFGILTSSVHMAWVRCVCGKLKSDFRYSTTIVYNNFPWPFLRDSASPREEITQTAKAILDARANHPDSSLADLYDEVSMPPDLRAAHEANDRAVLAAYGLAPDTPEPEIVAYLFGLYAKMMKETKRTEATKATSDKETAVSLKSFSSLKSLSSLRSLEGDSNG